VSCLGALGFLTPMAFLLAVELAGTALAMEVVEPVDKLAVAPAGEVRGGGTRAPKTRLSLLG